MPVEAKIEPFFEWLLGPNWHQGAFYHWLPMLAGLVLAAILIGGLIAAVRYRPATVARVAGGVLGTGTVLVAVTLLVLLARWSLNLGWVGFLLGWARPIFDFLVNYLDSMRRGLMLFLEWLLGPGWYLGALYYAVLVVGTVAVVVLLLAWLVTALRHGPRPALSRTGQLLAAGLDDLMGTSSRRLGALTWLAVKESIRLRVVVVFVLFILIPLFGPFFLDPGSPQPARLYLNFVLTVTSFLMLLSMLFLSALSLPADIKNKTLHTVVTKPVRPSEIVLGRIFGFTIIGTALLAVMGAISYGFVIWELSHTHQLDPRDLARAERIWGKQLASGKPLETLELQTLSEHNHRHHFRIRPTVRTSGHGGPKTELRKKGWVKTDNEQGHWHKLSYEISTKQSGGQIQPQITYRIGRPQDRLIARVPIYGRLRFKDRAGRDTDKGVNVGDEWTYRSFIEGGTLATAIWTFEGITESNFPKAQFPRGLPLEMTVEIFRTYKGETDEPEDIPGIPGSLWVCNPTAGEILRLQQALEAAEKAGNRSAVEEIKRSLRELRKSRADVPPPVEVTIFEARDFAIDVQYIPHELDGPGPGDEKLDLFNDLVDEGKLEVWLRCVQPAQYFGAAQADVYFRARDASFTLNFVKGYLGIWLQMVLVITFGVMFSTFLSRPIALIATAGVLVLGFFSQYMANLGANQFMSEEARLERGIEKVYGGGPVEAFGRLITQDNVTSELAPGFTKTATEMADALLGYGLFAAAALLPDFGQYSFARPVAYGFDISAGEVFKCAFRALTFLLPLFVAGYFFLKTREVAR